jgi:hypothetical protein
MKVFVIVIIVILLIGAITGFVKYGKTERGGDLAVAFINLALSGWGFYTLL